MDSGSALHGQHDSFRQGVRRFAEEIKWRQGIEALRLGSIEFAADNCASRDPGLLRLLAQAHALKEELVKTRGTSVREIARREGLDRSHFIRLVRLAFLAPDITATILEGRQPPELSARRLIRNARLLPFDWAEQQAALGFDQSSIN
jgi:ParB-like chromosome segregation protein Spo0J